MALESATFVNGLVSANPSSGDPVTQADDHMRLIKSVLLATFPNLSGPVPATPTQLNSWVPTGGIIAYTGSVAPTGWALCDGGTYAKLDGSGNLVTPDLRSRFIMGAGPSNPLGTSGGSLANTTAAGGFHTPTGTASTAGAHSHTGSAGATTLTIAQIPNHTHTFTGPNSSNPKGGSDVPYAANAPVSGNVTDAAGGGGSHTHTISSDGDHTHTLTMGAVADHTHNVTVTPPYYALTYIARL